MECCGRTLDIAEVILEHSRVLVQNLVNELIGVGVELVDSGPVNVDVLKPVTSEQGGSSARDHEERELVLLVLIRHINHYFNINKKYFTCICGELY